MKIRLSLALALLVVCTSAFAQDKAKGMSAEEKAAMDAMMKAMTPGENHKLLDGMVGTFDAKVTMWMQPGAPPVTSTGKSVNSWILGNRYIEQKFDGSVMGMPFSGLGYTGYDNVKKQYWGTWMDNMSTGVMLSTGSMTDAGKVWTFKSTMSDPMTGKETTSDMRVTVADHDHHTMEMWGPAPDGKTFKMMEIAYTRAK